MINIWIYKCIEVPINERIHFISNKNVIEIYISFFNDFRYFNLVYQDAESPEENN